MPVSRGSEGVILLSITGQATSLALVIILALKVFLNLHPQRPSLLSHRAGVCGVSGGGSCISRPFTACAAPGPGRLTESSFVRRETKNSETASGINTMALGNSTNKLFIIGLGLGDPTDISLKGLAAIKMCKTVYLERYTSVLFCDVGDLEALYGTKIEIADRDFVENNADIMLQRAKEENVAFLVAGSPLAATTHYDLILRARDAGVSVHLIPNASILDAVGVVGLQLYRFGQTVSIPWFTETWKPESFVENIEMNRKRYLHSLCLLDIQMKEPDPELLAKGETVYMPPRFMNLTTAVEQILHVLKARRIRTGKTSSVRRGWGSLGPNSYAVGIARAGTSEMKIIYGTLEQLSRANIGPPLHSLIIPAPNLHAMEIEALRHFRVSNRTRAGKRGRRARLVGTHQK